MIDIGRLNKRITFLSYQEMEDECGQIVQGLKSFKTVWASVEPISGKEADEAQRTVNEVGYRIYIRYLKGVEEFMLIEYHGKLFEIVSILNKMERNEVMQLNCKERKPGEKECKILKSTSAD